MDYLCIKNGQVINAIVADEDFVSDNPTVDGMYDELIKRSDAVSTDPLNQPWIGWVRNEDGSFSPEVIE